MTTTPSPLSVELRLLLACCRIVIAQEEQKRQRAYTDCRQLIAEPVLDWSAVIKLAEMHKIYPLLYRGLQQANALEFTPVDIRHTLLQIQQRQVRLALTQTAELVRLNKLFQAAGIPVMPLKGLLLAQRLWGDLGARQSGDLDLLVEPAQLDKAEQILITAGYRKQYPNFPLTPRQQGVFMQTFHHCNFVHADTKILVELHWKPFDNEHLLPEAYYQQMRQRLVTQHIANVPFIQFADADLLLYLCLHGAKHQWYRLKWLCDVAALLHRDWPLDWALWAQTIGRLGLERPIRESFILAHHFLDAPLSPPWRAAPADEARYQQTVHSFSQRFAIDIQAQTGGGKVNYLKFATMFNRPTLRQNWAYHWQDWRNMWCMVDDWRDFPLPDSLFPLYYVLRPFFWFWRYYIPLPPYPDDVDDRKTQQQISTKQAKAIQRNRC